MGQTTTLATPALTSRTIRRSCWPLPHVLIIFGLWLFLFAAALFTPPLLDDADSTHAQAAQAMLTTRDWVTLHVDGIRYLEKPPLPYWIAALSLRLFAPPASEPSTGTHSAEFAAFAIHLPLSLTVLGLALLGYAWSRRAFGSPAALYTALFVLTSAGVFLFTRVFIPDALLSLLLAFSLYALLRSLEQTPPTIPTASKFLYPYALWTALALAVLTKGLVTLVFFFSTAILFLVLTRQLSRWRELRPFTGVLLFLAIAAPWHILAGLRNTGGSNGHGFFWFYFINEHVLRFLGRRIPRDYNKLPGYLYWSLHLVWLFPWSLFAPAAAVYAWRNRRALLQRNALTFARQTVLILSIFSALVLVFFSVSTNQEYYTFPVYLPLLMLLAAALATITSATDVVKLGAEPSHPPPAIRLVSPQQALDPSLRRALTSAFAALTVIGLAVASALAYGLFASRHLPFVPDIGELLAHRDVGGYTLSMSHFFDLTGPSFAALRLPAAIALLAFLIGPALAWLLFARRRFLPAVLTFAVTSAFFLFAAHIALVRFSPMLSSASFARSIQTLESTHTIFPDTEILLYGDQAFGSSIPFYLGETSGHPERHVLLVEGRSTSMLFGSTFPDAPPIFLTPAQLLAQWGTGPRKLLFVPLEQRDVVDHLLGGRQIILKQTSGKALITDRPL